MSRYRERRAWMEVCQELQPNTVVHLVTNDFGSLPRMRHLIKTFAARVDDWGLGTTWSRQPPSRRMDGTFFIQHVHSNIHAHGLVRLPQNYPVGFQIKADDIWAKLCPAGSVVIEPIHWSLGIADYSARETEFRSHETEQVVLLAEFMSPTSLSKTTN